MRKAGRITAGLIVTLTLAAFADTHDFGTFAFQPETPAVTPEPRSMLLWGIGFAAIALFERRVRRFGRTF